MYLIRMQLSFDWTATTQAKSLVLAPFSPRQFVILTFFSLSILSFCFIIFHSFIFVILTLNSLIVMLNFLIGILTGITVPICR